jgi:hypothetical protein
MIANARADRILYSIGVADVHVQEHPAHVLRCAAEAVRIAIRDALQLLGCRRGAKTHGRDRWLEHPETAYCVDSLHDAIGYDIAIPSNNPDLIIGDRPGKDVDQPVATSDSTSENRQ